MKMILSHDEMSIMNNLCIALADEPIKENQIMSIKRTVDTVEIEIKEKYVVGVYGECNKWLPAIVGTVKGLVALVKSFYDSVAEREALLLSEIAEESKHKVNLKKETDDKQ